MALSTLSSTKKYDVFLSFRGTDTRRNFTGHLHEALDRKGIDTFRDDKLERGKEISQALLETIEESKISVVIFSENYAQSKWCLDELVKIMDCQIKMGQKVLPIFYHVDPSAVKKQIGNFGKAFEQVSSNSDRVPKWKAALTQAANLSGWVSKNYWLEADLCEEIADHIYNKLSCSCFSASHGLDGLDSQSLRQSVVAQPQIYMA